MMICTSYFVLTPLCSCLICSDSFMQVKYLQIAKKSKTYNPYRWVRYVTQANSYVARIWLQRTLWDFTFFFLFPWASPFPCMFFYYLKIILVLVSLSFNCSFTCLLIELLTMSNSLFYVSALILCIQNVLDNSLERLVVSLSHPWCHLVYFSLHVL